MKKQNKTITVVAALVWQQNKFLVCRRPANKDRALLWEFVGGKVEPGETHSDALVRECREELAVTVEVQDVYFHTLHSYDDVNVDLYLYNATIVDGTPTLLEHVDMRWITPQQTAQLQFCPADEVILQKLRAD